MTEKNVDKIFDDFKDKDYRQLAFEDIITCLLRGGASVDLAQKVQFILLNYYHDDYIKEKIEDDILAIHEKLLWEQGYKKKRNIQQEVDDIITFRGNGIITLNDIYNDLKLNDKEEKSYCRVALNRLTARGIIEKIDTGRTGSYRLIKKADAEEMKIIEMEINEFPIILPINLNDLCKLYAKNIIIVAGTKGSGKTAFLLKVAIENQNDIPIDYLNSEMGSQEYTERMKVFGILRNDQVKFKMYEIHKDFHDMITAERKIFIVDYMEIHDNFYEIAKDIRKIHEKLHDGICVIAIQKKGSADLGRGAEFSQEKARLYLTLDYIDEMKCTKVVIKDAKTPKIPGGVRGMFRHCKIIGGSRFSPIDNWRV